jgi:hypothetical protein
MRSGEKSVVSYEDYVAGWLDSSIHDFLGNLPEPSESMDFALITSLDSNVAASSLLGKSPHLESVVHDAKPLGTGILLPTALMLQADAGNRIFFGFDEVWFFPNDKIEPKPELAWLVGPNRIDQAKLDRLGPWLVDNGCSLALGDGVGLNFVVKARGLVRYLIGSSMSQPQFATAGEVEAV